MINKGSTGNSPLVMSGFTSVNQFNFEQIFLIGIPPDKTSDSEPKVLIAFPPYELPAISTSAVINNALPLGTKKRRAKVGSKLIQEEFAFTIANQNSCFYCASVIFLPNEAKTLPFFVSQSTKKTLFSFCIVSKVPSIASHLSFLTFLVNAVSGMAGDVKPIHVKPNDANYACYDLIDGLFEHSCGFGCIADFCIPDYLYDSVSLYHMCGPGTQPIELSTKHKLYFAQNYDKKQILYSGLDTLFSITDVKAFIDVLTGVLLDYQVLVIGSSMEEVSMVVLTLAHIIEPLEYSGMVITVLPETKEEYRELLGAPTPYIIGTLPSADILDIEFLDTTIFLNLDKKIIQIDKSLPPYPNKEFIINSLRKTIAKAPKQASIYSMPQEHISYLKHKYMFGPKTCVELIQEIMQPFTLILSDFIFSFFVTDLDTAEQPTYFNKDLFLDCMPKEKFFLDFQESQTFDMWVTKKLEIYVKEKGEEFGKYKRRHGPERKHERRRSLSTKLLGID